MIPTPIRPPHLNLCHPHVNKISTPLHQPHLIAITPLQTLQHSRKHRHCTTLTSPISTPHQLMLLYLGSHFPVSYHPLLLPPSFNNMKIRNLIRGRLFDTLSHLHSKTDMILVSRSLTWLIPLTLDFPLNQLIHCSPKYIQWFCCTAHYYKGFKRFTMLRKDITHSPLT